MASSNADVTTLIGAVYGGDSEAQNQLFRLIDGELRAIAEPLMRGERPDHSWQVTLLVDEAFMRLVAKGPWQNRKHFYRTAARAMRRLLIDHARKRRIECVSVEPDELCGASEAVDLEALNEALGRLEDFDSRMATVVELHHFGGRTLQETADILGASRSAVKRDWAIAKAWLHRELSRGDEI